MFFEAPPPPPAYVQMASVQAAAALAPSVPVEIRSAPMVLDTNGRPVIEATISGKGPFRFIVDTAAQVSFANPDLLQELSLIQSESPVVAQGASGQSAVSRYPITDFASPAFSFAESDLFSYPGKPLEARGVLGMSPFASNRLVFDYAGGQFGVAASGEALSGYKTLKGRTIARTFLVVKISLNGVEIDAVIDTRAARSIMNHAGLVALGYQEGDTRLTSGKSVSGATEGRQDSWTVPDVAVTVGDAAFTSKAIHYSELPVFNALGLKDTPAIILGNDVLPHLSAIALDFQRAEFQYRPAA